MGLEFKLCAKIDLFQAKLNNNNKQEVQKKHNRNKAEDKLRVRIWMHREEEEDETSPIWFNLIRFSKTGQLNRLVDVNPLSELFSFQIFFKFWYFISVGNRDESTDQVIGLTGATGYSTGSANRPKKDNGTSIAIDLANHLLTEDSKENENQIFIQLKHEKSETEHKANDNEQTNYSNFLKNVFFSEQDESSNLMAFEKIV